MDGDLRLRNDHEMQGNNIPSLISTDIYKNTCIVLLKYVFKHPSVIIKCVHCCRSLT